MALPGTQMFDSLYDNGKIAINREYFRHILAAASLWSTSTYNEHLSNLELTMWKLRLFRHFYKRRRSVESRGLASTVWRSVSHLRSKSGDTSKFQTAFRNGMISAMETAKSKLQREGWMSRADEERFFERWDEIFREIREKNVRDGVHTPAPADTRELHEINVISRLKAEHGSRRRIPVEVVAS
jgi:hypothetical protein